MRSRQETTLVTPPIPRLVPAEIFDAFGWCRSTTLVWRSLARGAREANAAELTADNPPGMVFLLDESCTFLPRELAALHVPELAGDAEWSLAPYAIDDATDHLYEQRVAPESVLQLATSSLAGLFWGLHDWAHFHNHGSFEDHQRSLTELQCDTAALTWSWTNRERMALDRATWTGLRRQARAIAEARFLELPASPEVDLLPIWTNVDRYLDAISAG